MMSHHSLAERVASIVLAGGQGTRLFPLTQARCKPSVGFGGRYRLIDIPISNSLNSKINRLFVISQYFASELHSHILSTYHMDLFGTGKLELLSPEETIKGKRWFLGTADAVRQNLSYLLQAPVDYFILLSGDQLYQMNLLKIVQFAIDKEADFVVSCLRVKTAEAKRMGILKIDADGIIVDFFEKPQEVETLDQFCIQPDQFLGSMGIYVFRRDIMKKILEEEKGEDFGKQIIPSSAKKYRAIAYIYEGYWEDIGTIDSYYHANLSLTGLNHPLNIYDERNPIFASPDHLPPPLIRGTVIKDSIIGQGAIIESKEISHSIIGMRIHTKPESIIKNSILLGNYSYYSLPSGPESGNEFTIGRGTYIENAIIDEGTSIGNNVCLKNKKNLKYFDGNGIYIRDGIMIVTAGTTLPDWFCF